MSRKMSIKYNECNCQNKISMRINRLLFREDIINRPLIIVCIGTDRSTGDSLGPLVGSWLERENQIDDVMIYGNLYNPVHATNIDEYISKINNRNDNPIVIAIDAGLSKNNEIGNINIKHKTLTPGIGVGKKLPTIGDISITGVINETSNFNYLTLQSTRLSLVYDIAAVITDSLSQTIDKTIYLKNKYKQEI